MIDYSNEIFTAVANEIREKHTGTKVIGEYVMTPKDFPTVTLDETYNVPAEIDFGAEKIAAVTYRAQVFSNKKNGKRAEAREIYKTLEEKMYLLNFIARTYTTTPEVYNSNIYKIEATFEAYISKDGVIHRR